MVDVLDYGNFLRSLVISLCVNKSENTTNNWSYRSLLYVDVDTTCLILSVSFLPVDRRFSIDGPILQLLLLDLSLSFNVCRSNVKL